MFARAVTLAALTTFCLLLNLSTAQGATAPAGGTNVLLNRQLSSIALLPTRPSIVRPSMLQELSPRPAVDPQPTLNWLSSPIFLAIASRFTSAERVLHYRHGGVDANLWGVLNQGRGIRIGYSVRL